MEPTNDEIRRTLAEFMGYSDLREVDIFPTGALWGYNPDQPGKMEVPDYAYDLNAMHEVEQELERRGLHQEYGKGLWDLSSLDLDRNPEFYASVFIIATTAAEQRARAAYAVIKQMGQEAKSE